MPLFRWQGRNARGESVQGQLDAPSDIAVADQLTAIGVSPVHIQLVPVDPGATAGAGRQWLGRWHHKAVNDEDVMLFARQMYTLNKAGVPILRALSGLQSSTTKPAMVEVIQDVRGSLDQGRELSAALLRHPRVFSHFFVAMTRVGEMTGRLSEVFLRLSEHLEFERGVRERIRQAMRYPSFVVVAMAAAMVIINIFVLPVFAKVFAGFNAQLPLLTRVLLSFSDWMVAWWPWLLVGVVLAWVLARSYVQTSHGRYRWDRLKLHIPIAGEIILKATLARFARSFALSGQSGVPFVQALTVVAQTVDNAYIGSRIEQMRDGIERGESIARCAAATGVFTPVVLQMLAVGEETGELDALLFEIADMYDRETDYSIRRLSTAIEPLLLTGIAVLVLILALGVFLPLWNMGAAALGKNPI